MTWSDNEDYVEIINNTNFGSPKRKIRKIRENTKKWSFKPMQPLAYAISRMQAPQLAAVENDNTRWERLQQMVPNYMKHNEKVLRKQLNDNHYNYSQLRVIWMKMEMLVKDIRYKYHTNINRNPSRHMFKLKKRMFIEGKICQDVMEQGVQIPYNYNQDILPKIIITNYDQNSNHNLSSSLFFRMLMMFLIIDRI